MWDHIFMVLAYIGMGTCFLLVIKFLIESEGD